MEHPFCWTRTSRLRTWRPRLTAFEDAEHPGLLCAALADLLPPARPSRSPVSALRERDTLDLDVERAGPLRHAEENPRRRIGREEALVDLVEGLEAVLGDAQHVALQDVVEVRSGRLERGLHLRQDQLGLALKQRTGCEFPGLRVERRHPRD